MVFLQNRFNWFFKSLANQLLSTYLLVIVFALASLTFWALFTIKSESIRDLRNSLEVGAVHLALEIDNDLALDSPEATSRIQRACDRYAARLSGSITVVNKLGHVLAESGESENETRQGKNISNEPEINEALAGIMSVGERNAGSRYKTEWLYVAYPVRSAGETTGVIRVGVPLTDLNQRLNKDLILFLQIMFVTLVTTVAISLWLAKRVTRPIKNMSELSRQIARSGDIRASLPVERSDEIGELVNAFNQMIDRLREEERLKQEFIANASHELQTPTMALGAVVEALQAGAIEDPELRKQFLNSLENLIDRQASLLKDLLDIAQLDASAETKWSDLVCVQDILKDAFEQIRPQVNKKELKLETNLFEKEIDIRGNFSQLQRAFINLLTNAVNYTPEQGSIKINLELISDKHVLISIEDTGCGIAEADIQHIFDRFYRVDKARSRSGSGGTGLGLAITREIILRHQGVISVKSVLGQGSIFSVQLPIYAETIVNSKV